MVEGSGLMSAVSKQILNRTMHGKEALPLIAKLPGSRLPFRVGLIH